ncbi:MAG: hypothetical protein KJO31_03940 [Gammaproteobacteria bacterium]|nr:hypothetical protein [Gammaproteobacteria bacterium]
MQLTKHDVFRNLGIVAICCTLGTSIANAGPREQAKRIHDRLAGVPPTAAVLDAMEAKVAGGDAVGAAFDAMDNPAFYNTTVREFATPWMNRERSVYVDMNDAVATVIGMIRDDVPFDQVLYGDVVYVGSAAATAIPYSQTDNDHYLDLQLNRVDLSDPAMLEQQLQSAQPGAPIGANETAGLFTTRGYAEAYFIAGTNRSAISFTSENFLCLTMDEFRDLTAHPDMVRQDVTRSPGGDSSIFLNDCLGCHAGLDSLAGGFAYYDFDEETQQLVYTDGVVQEKYLRDAATFPFGFETTNDSWINYWRTGPNAFVGWSAAGGGEGFGAKSLGMELAQTRQFSECQVKNVFEKVCHRAPNGDADMQAVEDIATIFEANNRSMKQVFAETAVHCMGD